MLPAISLRQSFTFLHRTGLMSSRCLLATVHRQGGPGGSLQHFKDREHDLTNHIPFGIAMSFVICICIMLALYLVCSLFVRLVFNSDEQT